MKLKTYLILSHLTVMIAPIVTGVLLYGVIKNYDKSSEMNEYINSITKMKEYENKLDNTKLYINPSGKVNFVNKEDKNSVQINLYDSEGRRIHSDNDDDISYEINKEEIYSNLYKIVSGYRAYSLKKPVFNDKDSIIGFYEIIIAKENLIKGTNLRTLYSILEFIAVIITIYIIIICLLNKKFNKPIKLLINGMNGYAEGNANFIEYGNKDEIGELIEHFNNMKKEIEDKKKIILTQQKTKEYMISAISHDLKTPLTSIRAYAEAMNSEKDLEKDKIKEYSSVILNKSDHMKKMIDDLMLYTLLTSDYEMKFVEVEGEEFFEMIFSGYNGPCEKSNIKLHVEMCVSGIYKVDVKQMMRVVDNLMANALRYTPPGMNIWMGAFSYDKELPEWIEDYKNFIEDLRNNGVLILVKNNGNTIPKEEQERIFNPFYQTDDSRNKTLKSGVGLGLSIVSLIIKKHNGKVKVLSENNSTVFACWLNNE